ncbi:MAG: hypothetical protein ACRCSI_06735, partial [Eubacterium aggregans]
MLCQTGEDFHKAVHRRLARGDGGMATGTADGHLQIDMPLFSNAHKGDGIVSFRKEALKAHAPFVQDTLKPEILILEKPGDAGGPQIPANLFIKANGHINIAFRLLPFFKNTL